MKFKLVETFEKQRYIYNGPVYSNNGLIASESNKSTYARSHKEAVNNILGQFCKELGFRPSIDFSLVKLVTKPVVNKPIENKSNTEYADGSEQISLF